MRILFFEWGISNEEVIVNTLRDMGHFVRVQQLDSSSNAESEEELLGIVQAVNEFHAESLFTVDYFPNMAQAAKQAGIFYYSWLFHLPQWNLYSYQAQLPNNRIFVFDKTVLKDLRQHNINTAQYISLPADKQILENAMRGAATKRYKFQSDVSYVGPFFSDPSNPETRFTSTAKDDERFSRLVELIKEKRFNYGKEILYRGVEEDIITFLQQETEGKKQNFFFAKRDDIIIQSVLAHKITVEERKLGCRMLARKFDFRLYSPSNTQRYPELNNYGAIDPIKDAPLVYNQSKVNVYFTPRYIQSGIPQQVLDIIACQGFVITNYQEELADEFEPDKEIVMYHSLEELIEKTDFYLKHEQQRVAILRAGYEKVITEYNYAKKLRKMLDVKSGSDFGF